MTLPPDRVDHWSPYWIPDTTTRPPVGWWPADETPEEYDNANDQTEEVDDEPERP